eukprot:4421456-Pyramimonas_sp.AAC.1
MQLGCCPIGKLGRVHYLGRRRNGADYATIPIRIRQNKQYAIIHNTVVHLGPKDVTHRSYPTLNPAHRDG